MVTPHQNIFLWLMVIASLTELGLCTKCYVCGANSSVAEKCIDEYPQKQRAEDIEDCAGSAVDGCMKSKYVDVKNRQIVTRGCAPEVGMRHTTNECKSTEVAGNKVYFCHCTEDFCNHSAVFSYSLPLICVIVAVGLLSAH